MSVYRRFLVLGGLTLILVVLGACATAPATVKAPEVEKPTQAPAFSPTAPTAPQPTATFAVLPTSPVPTPTSVIEARLVELEWPPRLRFGDSDVVRLALIPSGEGYTLTTEFPEHQTITQTVTVQRPGGYDLYAVARLDGVRFNLSPIGDQERYLPPNEVVTWRWSLTPRAPGQQRLSLALLLRWKPSPGTAGMVSESEAFTKSLDISVTSFFGLTRGQAMTTGLAGLILGGGLCLFMLGTFIRPARPALQTTNPNPDLVIEPRPGLELSPLERSLLRAIFRRYARLVLESEFLSGYSGARTFLAQPVRSDGRADAYTIVKIGESRTIQREFQNYETFVKDTLPPITARIQHPPVTVRSPRLSGNFPSGGENAALQYTFIGAPGQTPTSLRQALLKEPDPALLRKLFETFGPNWWMQRRPYTFRLAQEYDVLLPAHLVVESAQGKGKTLDGSTPPFSLAVEIGDIVTLRNFTQSERRVDGHSLSLRGEAGPGQPPLRVRWLSLANPNGASGKVVATRQSLLRGFVANFDRCGLPDPLQRLPALLDESVSGSQSTIHGDLNVENVLVGPGGFVWLIDFAQTRDGHPLFDFAHLEAEIIAHVIAPQLPALDDYLTNFPATLNILALNPKIPDSLLPAPFSLLSTLHDIAKACLFNPSQPREYLLALTAACLGALKYANLKQASMHLLYLTAAYLAQGL
jgi:hypothetical protein